MLDLNCGREIGWTTKIYMVVGSKAPEAKRRKYGGIRRNMTIESKEMDGNEKALSGGRTPLPMEVGTKYKIVLRGLGVYEGGQKKNFETDELTDEKIRNAALIVCSPGDAEEEYVVSFPVDSVAGKAILNYAQKDNEGVNSLKAELLNVIGFLGSKEIKTKEEYDHGYTQLFFDPETKANGDYKLAKGMPEGASLVGTEQRQDEEDVVEEEGLI
jgi:hypothetical protein